MLTEFPHRHTLLRLSRAGEELLWLHRETAYPNPAAWEAVWDRFRSLPVITRRRAAPGELIPVGVSLPDPAGWRAVAHGFAGAFGRGGGKHFCRAGIRVCAPGSPCPSVN